MRWSCANRKENGTQQKTSRMAAGACAGTGSFRHAARSPFTPCTTIATWHSQDKDVTFRGETYYWSKDREFFKVLGESSEFEVFEPQEYIAQGDKVVVLGHERQRIRATGQVSSASGSSV